MKYLGVSVYLSSSIVAILIVTLLLKSTLISGEECGKYDLLCESGECIDSVYWCDAAEDCSDGSDEKFCKKIGLLTSKDPNKCPSTYFKCKSGMCVPLSGRCNDFNNCEDNSDEENCQQSSPLESYSTALPLQYKKPLSTINHYTTIPTGVLSPTNEIDVFNITNFYSSLNASRLSVHLEQFSGLRHSDFTVQKQKARNWLLSQRNSDFGWKEETPRALVALYLSDKEPALNSTENVMLMLKQLEIQLALELERNGTKPLKLTELALYINALFISCKDPKNFYGDNLVRALRDSVNTAQSEDTFVNPSVYLTLCINNATAYNDTRALYDIFLNKNATIDNIDMQALVLLTAACIFQKTNFLTPSMYDGLKMKFLHKVNAHGFPGNVYEAALLLQALQEMKVTLTGLMHFILNHQQSDGSFGDVLSTYFVLPILAGKNMAQMYDHCGQRNATDFIPLDVLKNIKSKKMHVQYSLSYGFPADVTQTIQMHVTEGSSFLDVMRLAQEMSPKYRFKLSTGRDTPAVYSIGGTPNDAEMGMYWMLYTTSKNSSEIADENPWVHHVGDIKKLILSDGDSVLFWYRSV